MRPPRRPDRDRPRPAPRTPEQRGERLDRAELRALERQRRAPKTRRDPERAGGPTPPPATGAPTATMRIAKAMARAGLCSRREAERWIEEGRVSVNGVRLDSPARDVTPRDRILVDGELLPGAEPARLWRYHKPKGCVTTHRDPEGRPTVFERLPRHMPRVISIGRLDFNTEGLLLLTNDGELARHLELPSTGWLRRYRVRAFGEVTQGDLDALAGGIELEGVRYGPIEATLDQTQGSNVWLTIGLREGKNREVRNILASLRLTVNRLIRVSFGPFQLLDLPDDAVEHIPRRVLADQLGPEAAAQFGLRAEDPDERAAAPPQAPRGPRRPARGR
jgi:23S rRNA pseudouridine2605 synthase